jgi:hypothetical protein
MGVILVERAPDALHARYCHIGACCVDAAIAACKNARMELEHVTLTRHTREDLDSDAARRDPRTPEQRARMVALRMRDLAWRRLPRAAAVNACTAVLLFGAGSGTSAGLLGAATALALLPLRQWPMTEQTRATLARVESLLAGAALATAAWNADLPTVLAISTGVLGGACTRDRLHACVHLAIVTPALLLHATASPGELVGIVTLIAAAGLLIHGTHADLRERVQAALHRDELARACRQLAGHDAAPSPQVPSTAP